MTWYILTFKRNYKSPWQKNITANIYRIQGYDSIISGYFCTSFINFKLKSLLEYANLYSLYEHERNVKIILKCFNKFNLKIFPQLKVKPDFSGSRICSLRV